MKIGEFADMNHVTAKMLRHYDKIGLLQPASVDPETGYRIYDASQSAFLNWVIILKNLGFSLSQIRRMLSGPVDSGVIIDLLVQKRIDFISIQNGFDVGDRVIVACYELIRCHVERNLAHPVIGRAGGDEFIIFAQAGSDEIKSCAEAIVASLSQYDFSPTGCPLPMGCYFGGLSGTDKRLGVLRNMIESSIECLQKAREAGVNTVCIE